MIVCRAFLLSLRRSSAWPRRFMVIAARNPVHSVLFLILAFFNAAGLFMLLGAEFLAMILVVVYVGAVAVLFLFVVMMLDVDFAELRAGLPAISAARRAGRRSCCSPSWCWCVGGLGDRAAACRRHDRRADPAGGSSPTPRRSAHVLYTRYVYFFQGAGLMLLVAMIGAIVLTLRHKAGVKRQSSPRRWRARRRRRSRCVKVRPGQGHAGHDHRARPLPHGRARSCSRSASSASSSTARTSSSS